MDGFGTNPFATSGSTPLGGQNSGQSGAFPWLNNNNWWQSQQQGSQQSASTAPGSNQAMATALAQPSMGVTSASTTPSVAPPAPQFDTPTLGGDASSPTNAPATPLPGASIGPNIVGDPGQAAVNPAATTPQGQPSPATPLYSGASTAPLGAQPQNTLFQSQPLNPSTVAGLLGAS